MSEDDGFVTGHIEQLCHFQCYYCEKWWSIGDAPIEEKKDWFCPWCGKRVKIVEIHKGDDVRISKIEG